MKKVVDIFSNDWSHEILWTYVIELGDDHTPIAPEAFENEAQRMAIEEGRGDLNSFFAKARE